MVKMNREQSPIFLASNVKNYSVIPPSRCHARFNHSQIIMIYIFYLFSVCLTAIGILTKIFHSIIFQRKKYVLIIFLGYFLFNKVLS